MAEIHGWFVFRFRKGICWFGWAVARRDEGSFGDMFFGGRDCRKQFVLCKVRRMLVQSRGRFLVMDCEGLACALEWGVLY